MICAGCNYELEVGDLSGYTAHPDQLSIESAA